MTLCKVKKIDYGRNLLIFSIRYRRCSGCKKKRSLRSNSFFEEFPKVALGKLLLTIYFFTADDSQKRIARHLGLNPGLVSRICRILQDVCSRDLEDRPILPFGGPGIVVKCNESNLKVTPFYYHFRRLQFFSSFAPGKLFASHGISEQELSEDRYPVTFSRQTAVNIYTASMPQHPNVCESHTMKYESMLFVTKRLLNF